MGGVTGGDPELLIPAIGDEGERAAKFGDEGRQWVGEVGILAPAKAMTGHDDAAAEKGGVGVGGCQVAALTRCRAREGAPRSPGD